MVAPINEDLVAKYREKARTTSQALTFTDSLVLIYGSPGAGKTTLALTASEKFKDLPNKGEIIFCDDFCLIQTDLAATDGYKSAGYSCHVIDYRHILREESDPIKAILISFALARETGAQYFALDTVTQLGKDIQPWVEKNNPTLEGWKFWKAVGEANALVYQEYMKLSGIKFALGHSRALVDDLLLSDKDTKGKEAQARKAKAGMPGDPSITLDLTGAAKDVWMRLNSLQIAIRMVEPTPGKPLVRQLHTEYSSLVDMAVKNRFSFLIGPEPPFNLQKIIKAIRE